MVNVSELGGSSTDVYLVFAAPVFDFSLLSQARSTMDASPQTESVSTTLGPDVPFVVTIGSRPTWSGPASNVIFDLESGVSLDSWIPGDTLRIPISTHLQFNAKSGSPTVGEIKVRYERKVTVPEPSAALSLPIGGLGLAGQAAMKGSV